MSRQDPFYEQAYRKFSFNPKAFPPQKEINQFSFPKQQQQRQKKNQLENETDFLFEIQKLGLATVQTEQKNSDCQDQKRQSNSEAKLIKQKKDTKFIQNQCILQRPEQPLPKTSAAIRKKIQLFMKKIRQLLVFVSQCGEAMLKMVQNQEQFHNMLSEISNKLISIETSEGSKKKEYQKYVTEIEKTNNELKESNRLLRMEMQKYKNQSSMEKQKLGENSKIFLMKEGYHLLEIENKELKKEKEKLAEEVRKLTEKLLRKEEGKRENPQGQKETEYKEKYIKCIKNFSQQILYLEEELNNIRNESQSNSSMSYDYLRQKERELNDIEKLIDERQQKVVKSEEDLARREEIFQKEEFNFRLEKQKHRLKQKYLTTDVGPRAKKQIQRLPQRKIHYSPKQDYHHKKLQCFSPKNIRNKYFSPQNDIGKYQTARNREKVTSRIGKIENNVRKELEELMRKKHNF